MLRLGDYIKQFFLSLIIMFIVCAINESFRPFSLLIFILFYLLLLALRYLKIKSDIKYQASLKEDSIKVSYIEFGEEYPLFTIKGGESLNSSGGYVDVGRVPIILRSEGRVSGGEFTFSLN